jgi:hypothetical protein
MKYESKLCIVDVLEFFLNFRFIKFISHMFVQDDSM